jgi:hypothetical protein
MKKKAFTLLVIFSFLVGVTGLANAVIVDFTGGTAYYADGSIIGTTNNFDIYYNVAYYIQDGIKYEFRDSGGNLANVGIVGDYYSIGTGGFVGNDVIHAHWDRVGSMVISKVDGTAFDLNYIDLTSNTVVGGGQQDGTELTYALTNNGYSMLLPSSDWGFAYDFSGRTGDGVDRLYLDANFDGVTSVTFTSMNAYCFGLDNFYIDEPAPPAVPIPGAVWLLGSGLLGLAGLGRFRKG